MPRGGEPLAYFLTFTCHGTWLHGDERGSVHHIGAERTVFLGPNEARRRSAASRMKGDPVALNTEQRRIVDGAIRETCEFHGWLLHALNVRTNHVHVVVSSDASAARTLSAVKAWATTRLKQAGLMPRETEVWTRGGSKRLLFREEDVTGACWYVLEQQGPELV